MCITSKWCEQFLLFNFLGHRPVARIEFGWMWDPQKWTFWTQRVDFLNLTTLTKKTHFWPTLWLKVDLLADLGGASHPLATGLLDHII